ncbi:MAG: amidohydrolase [Candidatus Bathyarchaeota archaeon]|nr:amidohydrolase [Candidatus Bathyarchaeota archaeon]
MDEEKLAIIDANVVTLDPNKPQAQAITIGNGKILDVGKTEDILSHADDRTTVMDLQGRTVVPGFIDSHVHMLGFGRSLQHLDLRNVKSIEELQSKLRKYARDNPQREWILGGRWDQERFSEERYPNRWDLDAAVDERPVFLTRVCGHICVANSKALELAEIGSETKQLKGIIEKDKETGEPTGILREKALGLIRRVMPKPNLQEIEKACLLACQKAAEAGLTGVNWLVSSADELRALQKLYEEDRLPIRVYLGIPAAFLHHLIALGLVTGFGNDMIKIGFVKVMLDGSLGGHTAALNEPYSDRQDTKGMLLYTQEELNRIILDAQNARLQVAIHAIGDLAVNVALGALERAKESSLGTDHRHRIEHCSALNPTLVERMKQSGIIASVQPHFVVSDFWVKSRVGEGRARWVYPFRSLLQAEIAVAAGSDCPVEPIDPLLGIWAACARAESDGENVTADDALRMYTLNGAYASFDEDRRGSIEAAKFADLTVLSADPRSVPPDKIKDISVEMVIVGGRIVYGKPQIA